MNYGTHVTKERYIEKTDEMKAFQCSQCACLQIRVRVGIAE